MERRKFIQIAGASVAAFAVPAFSRGQNKQKANAGAEAIASSPWRTVEVTTSVKLHGEAAGKIWLPLPIAKTSYQEHLDTMWNGNFSRAGILKDDAYGACFFYGEWSKPGVIELNTTLRLRIRDRTGVEKAPASEAEVYLKPSKHVPVDGMVKTTSLKIVGKQHDNDRKARDIYEWMVENTSRDKSVRGCGAGDIKPMLETNHLEGKCADLSSLFVGLCRASGVPAREVFGLRVLPSKLSKSIGKEGDVSGAQHCRAEYYSTKQGGWIPVDPADVRKVILEESMTLQDGKVEGLRQKLFGFWEMNWIAFNSARDFTLPPQSGELVNYMMYPYYAAGNTRKDGMDPKNFEYSILAKEA